MTKKERGQEKTVTEEKVGQKKKKKVVNRRGPGNKKK